MREKGGRGTGTHLKEFEQGFRKFRKDVVDFIKQTIRTE